MRSRADALIPLGRVGTPADLTGMALALLNEQISGYMTGSDVVIDGGLAGYNWLHHLYGDAAEERRIRSTPT